MTRRAQREAQQGTRRRGDITERSAGLNTVTDVQLSRAKEVHETELARKALAAAVAREKAEEASRAKREARLAAEERTRLEKDTRKRAKLAAQKRAQDEAAAAAAATEQGARGRQRAIEAGAYDPSRYGRRGAAAAGGAARAYAWAGQEEEKDAQTDGEAGAGTSAGGAAQASPAARPLTPSRLAAAMGRQFALLSRRSTAAAATPAALEERAGSSAEEVESRLIEGLQLVAEYYAKTTPEMEQAMCECACLQRERA